VTLEIDVLTLFPAMLEAPLADAAHALSSMEDGELDYVGSCAVAAGRHDEILKRVAPLLKGAPDRGFSEPNRWGTGELQESAVRPELVAEVRYDKVQGNRFRHGSRFLRFRDDKDPEQCTWREVRPQRRKDDPTFESLLAS